METLLAFVLFKRFISLYVLIPAYYIGAVGIPFFGWFTLLRVRQKYPLIYAIEEQIDKLIYQTDSGKKTRAAFILIFAIIFVLMEIMWRMLFEYLIAFLQIRDTLLQFNAF
ncbi:MAG: DUF4282 domain-containing protein [Syntrophales bacterium]|nr:DUF4282 domain-containing protein [Syntrophales bacterium]